MPSPVARTLKQLLMVSGVDRYFSCEVLPRRGPACRPPARVYSDRLRDGFVGEQNDIIRLFEGMAKAPLQGNPWRGTHRALPAYALGRRYESTMVATRPDLRFRYALCRIYGCTQGGSSVYLTMQPTSSSICATGAAHYTLVSDFLTGM